MNKELRLGSTSKNKLDGGLCLYEPSSISINQSPYGGFLNMCLDDGGQLTKRQGQKLVYQTSLGDGAINGMYADYKGLTIIAHGTKLYSQKANEQPVEIFSSINNAKTFMFAYSSTLYIINGGKYLKFDGTTVSYVVPYVPRVSFNRKPDGSNSAIDESWNMIGRGFKDSFNADGTAKTYKLSMQGLDVDVVTSNIGGTEGNGFTVDRAKGEVTFTTPPPTGTNNLEIIGYKTFNKLSDSVLNCTFACEFSNRMFFGGNKDLPNSYFAGGLSSGNDATYFPQKYQYQIRGTDKAITGFKVHYNKLVVFKEDLCCTVESSLGLDNTASFPIEFLNTDIGCDIPDSIQLINNNIVFSNTTGGVYMIISTQIPGEKSILPVSLNINGSVDTPGLLQENISDLKKASSIDYGYKYYLCINDKCYVWDYKDNFDIGNPRNLRWLLYDNINAHTFGIKGTELFYGDRNTGVLKCFTNILNDFGQPINSIWSTKLMDFSFPDMLKTINYIWYTCKANSLSTVTMNFLNDRGDSLATQVIATKDINIFAWDTFKWDNHSWKIQLFSPTIKRKVKVKKVKYFQIEFRNNVFNENLSIISLVIDYLLVRKVK